MLSRTMAFLLGILALQQFSTLPSWPWLSALLLVLVLLLLLPHRRPVWQVLAALGFGLFWAALHAHWMLLERLNPELEGLDLSVQGIVSALPQDDGRRLRFEFLPLKASLDGEAVELNTRLRLNWYNDYPAEMAPGQQWQLLLRLKRPWGMMNPGGFDYEGWLYQQGLGATGYVRRSSENQVLADDAWSMPLQRQRHALQQGLMQALDGHPAQGIILALAIGDRSQMNDEQWKVLIATGTNHLVAISGLHVGLVAGFVFFLLRRLWGYCPVCSLWLPAPRAAAIGGMLAALLYAALAGFAIPTQRALLMLVVVLGAVFLQRPLVAGRALMLALWLVLLWQPTAVLAAGFWLSFAAVALILYGMQGRIGVRNWWWRWGRVQYLVSLGLLPLLILFFGRGSLSSPLANIIAVPWVSLLVVPPTLLGSALLVIHPGLGGLLLQAAAWLFQLLWPLLSWLEQLVPVLQLSLDGWPLLLAALGLVWLLLPRGWPLRSLGLVLCLPVLLLRPATPPHGEVWFTLLDVGQGQAAVIQTRHHALVMDTGPRFPSGFDTGSAVLLPYLHSRGIHRVDRLIISHSDTDHLGGAASLVEAMPVAEIFSGEARRMGWTEFEPCQRGLEWEWDGVHFRFLHPVRPLAEREGNDDACVLRVSHGGQVLLIGSDIEAAAERDLLVSGEPLRADVLVAPHHGSLTSSTPPFVEAVSPTWVLYSAGYRNRYGHPREEVMARYQGVGARQYISWQEGAMQMRLGGEEGITLQAHRSQARRYWHSPR